MKLTRVAIAIATSAMISTPVLATNGDNLIGLGAQSRAMGGTGAAAAMGSESALNNPALLGKTKGTEFTIGGTLFMPNVKAKTNVATQAYKDLGVSTQAPTVSDTSSADTNVIPEVSLSHEINNNLTFGLGIFGSAGMGVNYKDLSDTTGTNAALFQAQSNLQIMRFAPSIAYNTSRFGFGFAPILQYGSLDMNYQADITGDGKADVIGSGMSSDLGWGYNIGGYFDINKNLTIGIDYQSAIDMKYDDQITQAACGFGLGKTGCKIGGNTMSNQANAITSDNLEQPAELKVGIAYTHGALTFTGDYKKIQWGSAKGYKDFNWKDQDVIALGAKYDAQKFWLGVGYNYAEDPIEEKNPNVTNSQQAYVNQAVNLFNNHFFPGVVEQHFTFGGGYSLTKNLAIDGAITYAPQVTKTVNTTAVTAGMVQGAGGTPSGAATSHTVEHSQMGYTVSLRMNF